MKVSEVNAINYALFELSQKELPIKTAYKVQVNYKKTATALETPQKMQQELIDNYKEENADDLNKKDKLERFNKDMEELSNQEVEDMNLKTINFNELENISVKPNVLESLGDLLIMDDEEPE